MEKALTIQFRGIVYEIIGEWSRESLIETPEFQLKQLEYLVEQKDWVSLQNRIISLEAGGYLKKVSYI